MLNDILYHAGINQSQYEPGDPYGTTYNAGKQYVGNRVLRCLHLSHREIHDLSQRKPEYDETENA